jgi:tetratricopeptide (TPR) repeat protein
MAKNVKNAPTQVEANVGEIFSRSERFIETYKNSIIIIVAAVILIVVAIIGSRQYYFLPKEIEAQAAIYPGENFLENQQWELALKGDSVNYIGFLGIIEDYGITKTAKLAKYYAGVCYYHLGQPEEALNYLKKVSFHDKVIDPLVLKLIGDCYVEQEKTEEAIKHFLKAADKANSDFQSPIFLKKAAIVCESASDYKQAIKIYHTIKDKYPESTEANNIEKYIERASLKIE